MPTAATPTSVEEYLATTYEPDVDYDDGRLIARNVGKFKHARLQFLIGHQIAKNESEWRILGLTEQRIRVGPQNFCVADLCAIGHDQPQQDILEYAPLFTIELLSDGDAFSDVEEKGRKYLNLGVPYVWTVDPESGRCYRHSAEGMLVTDGTLRIDGSPIAIPVAELVSRLTKSEE